MLHQNDVMGSVRSVFGTPSINQATQLFLQAPVSDQLVNSCFQLSMSSSSYLHCSWIVYQQLWEEKLLKGDSKLPLYSIFVVPHCDYDEIIFIYIYQYANEFLILLSQTPSSQLNLAIRSQICGYTWTDQSVFREKQVDWPKATFWYMQTKFPV